MSSAVAITGLGCLCAAGMTLDSAYAGMLRGERNPLPPVAFSTSHTESYPVFEILEPLPAPATDFKIMRTTRLAISAAMEALADAGLKTGDLDGLKVGVCIGTTVGCTMNIEEFYRDFHNGEDPSMTQIERYLHSNPAAAIACHYQLDGPLQSIGNACTSGADAIGVGAAWIRNGLCDIALVGGADELCRTTYNGFSSLMINDPNPCRPFDARRKGLNLGEGAGILVLESRKSVLRRKKKERGFVLGYGSATDAHHLTAPHPDGVGLRRAVDEALLIGGLAAADLAFVNAHGTGTPDNDRTESWVLADRFGSTPFISTKCYTGHTLGAAGAIEAAISLVCMERGQLPANLGFSNPDPELLGRPAGVVTPVTARFALSQSIAFGGNNAALLLGLEIPQ